jgi:hypothetical protein
MLSRKSDTIFVSHFVSGPSWGSSVQATYTPSIVGDRALQSEDKGNADLTPGDQRSHYDADRPWSVNGHTSQGEPTTRREFHVGNLDAERLYIKHNTF